MGYVCLTVQQAAEHALLKPDPDKQQCLSMLKNFIANHIDTGKSTHTNCTRRKKKEKTCVIAVSCGVV